MVTLPFRDGLEWLRSFIYKPVPRPGRRRCAWGGRVLRPGPPTRSCVSQCPFPKISILHHSFVSSCGARRRCSGAAELQELVLVSGGLDSQWSPTGDPTKNPGAQGVGLGQLLSCLRSVFRAVHVHASRARIHGAASHGSSRRSRCSAAHLQEEVFHRLENLPIHVHRY